MGAEKNLAVEVQAGIGFGMIEGDDVGGAIVGKPALVEGDHCGQAEEVQAEGVSGQPELVFEQVTGDADELGDADRAGALAVADLDFVHGTCLPRCSS